MSAHPRPAAPEARANWPDRLLLAALALMPCFFNLCLPVFIALGLHAVWQAKGHWRQAMRSHPALFMLLTWSLALTPLVPDPGRHLYGWLTQFAFAAMLWLLVRQRVAKGPITSSAILSTLLLGALPICLIGWLQYLNLGFVIRFLALPPSDGLWSFYLIDWIVIPMQHAHARVYSLFFAPPMLGVYLATLLPISIAKVQQAVSRRQQAGWGLTLFLIFSVLVLSFTRIAWIAAAITVPVYFMLSGTRRSALWLLAGSAVLAAISLMALPGIWMHSWQRLQTVLSLSNHSNSGRIELWQRSWEAFTSRPLTGNGLLSYWQVIPEYRGRWPHAHSLVLQQLFETGLIATLLFYAWLTDLFRRLAKDPVSSAVGCGLLAWMICGWADYPGFEPRNWLLFWVLAGLVQQASGRADGFGFGQPLSDNLS